MPVRAVFLAFGLLTFGGCNEMTTTQHSGPQLIGEAVTVSYVADPSVGHGQFRLENHGDVAMMAVVKLAWLELGGRQQPLAGVTVFDLDQDQMMNPENFKVGVEATVTFLLGFSKVAYEPHFGESAAVGLRLRVNGTEIQALSPIKFVRRIPYGH